MADVCSDVSVGGRGGEGWGATHFHRDLWREITFKKISSELNRSNKATSIA